MVTEPLQALLARSFEGYLCFSTKTFLEGQQSFRWITQVLSRSGLQKQETGRLLLPLRYQGDSFRAAALFNWLEEGGVAGRSGENSESNEESRLFSNQRINFNIKNIVPNEFGSVQNVDILVEAFLQVFQPVEADEVFHVFTDSRTNARYCNCHIPASKLVPLSTTDSPLDFQGQPQVQSEDQSEYKANLEIVTSPMAFERMKEDAKKRRSFSNLVAEFTTEYDPRHPLKIIGGQHRFQAIKEAFEDGVDEYHGVKVYFGLDSDQRLDVQLISNTVIAVSADLYDWMQETVRGPELRNWCQKVGLLPPGQDFADKRQRGTPITVRAVRTFLINYYAGAEASHSDFEKTETTPVIAKSGEEDGPWDLLRNKKPSIWKDSKLEKAGREFGALLKAQRDAFKGAKGNPNFQEKALNYAVLSAWAYVAGLLGNNDKRLQRHYELKLVEGKDPLNAAALANGRHRSDGRNYPGLGFRTDAKERGRFVELFYAQAEKGQGINPTLINVAIAKYHAKQAALDVEKAEKGEA